MEEIELAQEENDEFSGYPPEAPPVPSGLLAGVPMPINVALNFVALCQEHPANRPLVGPAEMTVEKEEMLANQIGALRSACNLLGVFFDQWTDRMLKERKVASGRPTAAQYPQGVCRQDETRGPGAGI